MACGQGAFPQARGIAIHLSRSHAAGRRISNVNKVTNPFTIMKNYG
jgi:hypothetical protein